MGFLDSAQGVFDKGVSVAKGAVSGVAVEQQAFSKGFVRVCSDGWQLGWHERNGGNLSYRLTPEEVASCRSFFYDNPSSWVSTGVRTENLGGEYFLVKAAGSPMRNVALDLSGNAGIIEIDPSGQAWRIVWGFKNGGMPTSELGAHLTAQSARKQATSGESRVVYHAHPAQTVAMTGLLPLDSATFSRALWKSFTESIVAFPEGVAVLAWAVPGSVELAERTGVELECFQSCIWAQHGVLTAGKSFDDAFGLMNTIEKAAEVYNISRAANGGRDDFLNQISDSQLRAAAAAYGLRVNEAFLS